MKFDLGQLVETGVLDFLNHTAFHPANVTATYDPTENVLHVVPAPPAVPKGPAPLSAEAEVGLGLLRAIAHE